MSGVSSVASIPPLKRVACHFSLDSHTFERGVGLLACHVRVVRSAGAISLVDGG